MPSVLFLAAIFGFFWTCSAVQPLGTPTDLFTRNGCNISTSCSAMDAMTIMWSTSRISITFTNTTTRSTWSVTNNGVTMAILAFTNITTEDQREYSCIIVDNNGGVTIHTIRVIVEEEDPITMAQIPNYPLEDTTVGDSITIGCVIETCGSPNTVNFIRVSTSSVEESITQSSDGAFNWSPIVSEELAGTYQCIAENSLGSAIRTFMITGTPQPAPTPTTSKDGCNLSVGSPVLLTSMSLLSLLVIVYN